MKNPKSRTSRTKPLTRHGASKRQLVHSIRKARRSNYPVHKRMLLNPLSMFILLCTGVFMAGWTYHVVAATLISSTIEAPPLDAPATIDTPDDGAAFVTSPTHITGSCPDNSYVELDINGAFHGAGLCDSGSNTYDIVSSLHGGTNTLDVQDYNLTDLAGPDSDSVQVTYTPPVAAASSDTSTSTISGSQSTISKSGAASNQQSTTPIPLLLTSDFQFHTFVAQKAFTWDLDLEGGTPPYDVNIDWGDGTTGHLRFPGDPVFTLRHVFQTDGYYAVVVNSTDKAGQQHVMQLAALITNKDGTASFLNTSSGGHGAASGGAGSLASGTGSKSGLSSIPIIGGSSAAATHVLLVAWPFYIIVALMTVSFWLGEKREINLLVAPARHHYRH